MEFWKRLTKRQPRGVQGPLAAMGSNPHHDIELTPPSTTAVAVALGELHAMALLEDGTVCTWGDNCAPTPEGLGDVVAIAAGGFHSLALKSDGTVVGWSSVNGRSFAVPEGLEGVRAITAGRNHGLGLREDSTVVAWGNNSDGQCDVPYGLTNVRAIAAGAFHSVALTWEGQIYSWGHPDTDQRHIPPHAEGAVAIAAGFNDSSAIHADGSVVDWGGRPDFLYMPQSFHNVATIAYGRQHRVALREDGTLSADGSWMGGLPIPEGLPEIAAVSGCVSAGHFSFLALTSNGKVLPLMHDVAKPRTQTFELFPPKHTPLNPVMDVPEFLTK